MTINLENIYPLIVPANYYVKGTRELPHYKLSNHAFILTWVTFDTEATMCYITQEQYQALVNNYDSWQQKSFDNLRQSMGDNENFFTYYKISEDAQELLWICFINRDGIGSSRLLLSKELTKGFSNGYYLAFPDRSCGLVIAKDISEKELREIKDLVRGMYKGATTAMSEQLHSPSDFALPSQWTEPTDIEFSNVLSNEILKLKPVKL